MCSIGGHSIVPKPLRRPVENLIQRPLQQLGGVVRDNPVASALAAAVAAYFLGPAGAAVAEGTEVGAAATTLTAAEGAAVAEGTLLGGEATVLGEAAAAGAIGETTSAGTVAFGGAVEGTGGLTSAQALSAVEASAAAAGGAGAVALEAGEAAAPAAAAETVAPAAAPTTPTGPISGGVSTTDALLAAAKNISLGDAALLASLGSALFLGKPGVSPPEAPAAPEAPPTSQEGLTPEQDVFTRKRRLAGDPTALTGAGGIPFDQLIFGKPTVLGA